MINYCLRNNQSKVIGWFLLILLLQILSTSCCEKKSIHGESSNLSKEKMKDSTILQKNRFAPIFWNGKEAEVVKSLENGEYKLEIKTVLINDTLDVPDFSIYVTPVIKRQELHFYKEDKKIGTRLLAIELKKFASKSKGHLRVPSIPQFQACLVKGAHQFFYILNGSDFCFTGHCPEFVGIYTMEGNVVHESISTKGLLSKKYMELIDFCNAYQVDINDDNKCVSIREYKKLDYPYIENN